MCLRSICVFFISKKRNFFSRSSQLHSFGAIFRHIACSYRICVVYWSSMEYTQISDVSHCGVSNIIVSVSVSVTTFSPARPGMKRFPGKRPCKISVSCSMYPLAVTEHNYNVSHILHPKYQFGWLLWIPLQITRCQLCTINLYHIWQVFLCDPCDLLPFMGYVYLCILHSRVYLDIQHNVHDNHNYCYVWWNSGFNEFDLALASTSMFAMA